MSIEACQDCCWYDSFTHEQAELVKRSDNALRHIHVFFGDGLLQRIGCHGFIARFLALRI